MKFLIPVAIIVLLGAGVGYLVVSHHITPYFKVEQTSTTTTTATTPAATADTQKSLVDLIASGAGQQCTFGAGTEASGISYVGNGKSRSDISATSSSGQVMKMHAIADNQTMYTWFDGVKTGNKIVISSSGSASAPAAAGNQSGTSFNPSQKATFVCQPWVVDSSKFILPTDVTFIDSSTGAQSGPAALTGGSNSSLTPCTGLCDKLTGSDVATCKAKYKCP